MGSRYTYTLEQMFNELLMHLGGQPKAVTTVTASQSPICMAAAGNKPQTPLGDNRDHPGVSVVSGQLSGSWISCYFWKKPNKKGEVSLLCSEEHVRTSSGSQSVPAASRHEHAASCTQGFGALPEDRSDSMPSFRLGWSRTGQCLGP